MAFQNGCLFDDIEHPFYGSYETVQNDPLSTSCSLERYLFWRFHLDVMKHLYYGCYGTVKEPVSQSEPKEVNDDTSALTVADCNF